MVVGIGGHVGVFVSCFCIQTQAFVCMCVILCYMVVMYMICGENYIHNDVGMCV